MYHQLDMIDNRDDLIKYFLKVEDEYGHLPKEVKSLFEKKKLELLYNSNFISKITNRNGTFTIILSKDFSDSVDGVKLFEMCNNISRDIKIAYKNSQIELSVTNQKDAVEKILKLVDNLEEIKR